MRQEQSRMTKTECFRQTRSTSCHGRIAMQLCLCLGTNEIADWLTTGKTVLVMKDREKRNDVTNFKPITCLSLKQKIFTVILSDEQYDHLESERLLPKEQKGC